MPRKTPVVVKNKLADGNTFEDLLHKAVEANEEGTSASSPVIENKETTSTEPQASAPSTVAEPALETVTPKPFVYDEFWNSLPKEGQDELVRRSNEYANNQVLADRADVEKNLKEQLGDLYDTDFIKMIAENKNLQKKLIKLKDNKLQDWFDIAYEQYEATGSIPGTESQSSIPKEVKEQLDELKEWKATQERTSREETERAAKDKIQTDYTNRRISDAKAVKAEYPELVFKVANESDPAYKLGNWIHEYAEYQSNRQQRYVSYKEVYEEYKALLAGRTSPPPAIPATSNSGPPNQPQAPTNIAESKQKFLQDVKKAGGTFDDFALSVAGKR